MANRILLQTKNIVKRFLWIDQGSDGSLYVGPSDPRIQALKKGSFTVPRGGSTKVRYDNGTKIDPPASYPKVSFHKSGQIHITGGKHILRKIAESSMLKNLSNFLRICMVIPADPEKYPDFDKNLTSNDVVIPIDVFKSRPFVIEIVVGPSDRDIEGLLKGFRGLGAATVLESSTMQIALLFYGKSTFSTWAPQTYIIVPRIPQKLSADSPKTDGRQWE